MNSPCRRRGQELACRNRRLAKARVARLDTSVSLPLLEHAQLVVGRLLPIRGGDRLLADERSDRNAAELHLCVVLETVEHLLPVAAAHGAVEAFDVVTQELVHPDKSLAAGRSRSRRSVPVPSATPARISARPPSAEAVIGSLRKTAP